MPQLVLTYEQLKALKDLYSGAQQVNWEAYEEFRRIVEASELGDDDGNSRERSSGVQEALG